VAPRLVMATPARSQPAPLSGEGKTGAFLASILRQVPPAILKHPNRGHRSDALRLRLPFSVGAACASQPGQAGIPWSVLAKSS
jgi:hypothetical protein